METKDVPREHSNQSEYRSYAYIPVALLEQEVVVDELLSGLLLHAGQRVVGALQLALEAVQGGGHELLESTATKGNNTQDASLIVRVRSESKTLDP